MEGKGGEGGGSEGAGRSRHVAKGGTIRRAEEGETEELSVVVESRD